MRNAHLDDCRCPTCTPEDYTCPACGEFCPGQDQWRIVEFTDPETGYRDEGGVCDACYEKAARP